MNAPRLAAIVILAFTGCASVPLPSEAASVVLVPALAGASEVGYTAATVSTKSSVP